VVVEAVPFRADGWVAGRWSRRSHLGCGQDTRSRSRTIGNHSINLSAEGGDLLLEVVDGGGLAGVALDGVDLDDEIRDRCVDPCLPRRDLVRLGLERREAVAEGVDTQLEGGEALAELFHLVEEELGVGIHGAADSLLEAGVVGVVGIQDGVRIDQVSDTKLLATRSIDRN
jgi:hypothetical protein